MRRSHRPESAASAMLARRLAQKGLTLLPLGAFVASTWASMPAQPVRPPLAVAGPERRWAGRDLAPRTNEPMGLFRMDAVLPGTIELSGLNGTNGFKANGIAGGDIAGFAVSGAGDVNGDGWDDVLIAARNADPNGNSNAGQVYVVYGGTALPGTLNLSALSGANGFIANGVSTGDWAGWSANGAGDVNSDGFDDIVIGAPAADPNGASSGQAYVVYGGSAMPGTILLASLNGANGFRVNGVSTGDNAGIAVSGAGDVNGDGWDDVVVGAHKANPNGNDAGQIYVVYGGTAIPATVEASALNGTTGFRINGVSAGDYAGISVSGAGDVNGDAWDDVLIGSENDVHGNFTGQSYVVYGGTAIPATVEASALNGANGFQVNGVASGDDAGYSVSGAGDVNGDGWADILIGARLADVHGNDSGQCFVIYGGSALPGTIELSGLGSANGFQANGMAAGDQAADRVGGAGDVNGDGWADIIFGAKFAAPHGSNSGQSYVVYGGSALPGTIEASALNGANGFRANGIAAYDLAGRAVDGTGDVDGDGFDDIVIGSAAGPNGALSGQSYVVYGDGVLPPTATPTPSSTPTATGTPTSTPTATPTASATPSPTATPTSTATGTSTPTPTPTRTSTPTSTSTSTPSHTPTPTSTPTITPTPTQPPGDCNADNAVNAADVSGLVLEIFDGDGTNPAAAPGGSYPGDPNGCNANADAAIDAGDLSCTVRLIFGGGACGP